MIDDNQGDESRHRKKVGFVKVQFAEPAKPAEGSGEPAPVPPRPAGSSGDGMPSSSGGGGQAPAAAAGNDANDANGTTTEDKAWANAAAVFGSLDFAE